MDIPDLIPADLFANIEVSIARIVRAQLDHLKALASDPNLPCDLVQDGLADQIKVRVILKYPGIPGFTCALLEILHSIKLYPATVRASHIQYEQIVRDRAGLEAALAEIFADPTIKLILRAWRGYTL